MKRSIARLGATFLLAAALATPGRPSDPPAPQDFDPAPSCPATSLLRGLLPSSLPGVEGDAARLTDGEAAPEGERWDSPLAVRMAQPSTFVMFDLGESLTLRSLLLQADANDTYRVESSHDGESFAPLAEVPQLDGLEGLRSRAVRVPATSARYLRLSSANGDGRSSISEVQAFCAEPGAWEPRLRVVEGSGSGSPRASRWRWDDLSSRWWELVLALIGLAFLSWDSRRRRETGPSDGKRPIFGRRHGLFALVGLVSALTYFNFGAFHFGTFIHGWDTFHYYLGAKYFRELSYDGLYDCATVADATRTSGDTDAGYAARRARVERRKVRNLGTNELAATTALLSHPETCTTRFTAERWQAFQRDVAWFRQREDPARWDEIFGDHGFNATPVWNIAGSTLANLGPASDRQLGLLTLLDPLYFVGMAMLLLWGFGTPGAAVGLLVLATQFPARFFWTGGAYLRWDWLFFTVAAVVLLRRERPFLGGAALAYAALLRIFPLFLAIGPMAMLVAGLVREARGGEGDFVARWRRALRQETIRPQLRFFAGGVAASALLVGLSLGVNGGTEAYRHFAANTAKHQATPLTNHMGLRTVVSYRPAEVGRHLHEESAPEPWARWKDARLAAWARSRAIAAGIALIALALVVRGALRHRELWIGAALGAAFIPFAVELTSYYFAFLVVPALLFSVRRETGTALLLLGAFGLFISLAPVAGMPTWRDEQYTLIAGATLLTLLCILLRFAFGAPLFRSASRPV